jgi:hypothetical protein
LFFVVAGSVHIQHRLYIYILKKTQLALDHPCTMHSRFIHQSAWRFCQTDLAINYIANAGTIEIWPVSTELFEI